MEVSGKWADCRFIPKPLSASVCDRIAVESKWLERWVIQVASHFSWKVLASACMGVWHQTLISRSTLTLVCLFHNLQSRTLRGKFAHLDLNFTLLAEVIWTLGCFTSCCLGMPCKHISPHHCVCWESCDIISRGDPRVVLARVCVLIQTIAGHTRAPDTGRRTTKIREACGYIVNTLAHSETLDCNKEMNLIIHRWCFN